MTCNTRKEKKQDKVEGTSNKQEKMDADTTHERCETGSKGTKSAEDDGGKALVKATNNEKNTTVENKQVAWQITEQNNTEQGTTKKDNLHTTQHHAPNPHHTKMARNLPRASTCEPAFNSTKGFPGEGPSNVADILENLGRDMDSKREEQWREEGPAYIGMQTNMNNDDNWVGDSIGSKGGTVGCRVLLNNRREGGITMPYGGTIEFAKHMNPFFEPTTPIIL